MLPGRALARALSFVGVVGVVSAGLGTGTALAAGGLTVVSETPAAGSIVQPSAVTVGAPIQICFSGAVLPSTLTMTGLHGGSITGATSPTAGCPAGRSRSRR